MLQKSQSTTLEDLTERLQHENLRALWILRVLLPLTFISIVSCGFSPVWFFVVPVLLAGLRFEGYRSKRRRKVLEEAITPVGLFQERAGLDTLLRFRRALVFTTDEEFKLQALCMNLLHKLVPKATVDELERLGAEERKELVSLLTITLGLQFVNTSLTGAYKEPNEKDIEFSIALFLALTTLKEPGGERSARYVLRRYGYGNERLRESAQEYLSRERTSSALPR